MRYFHSQSFTVYVQSSFASTSYTQTMLLKRASFGDRVRKKRAPRILLAGGFFFGILILDETNVAVSPSTVNSTP
jgi:hypothetical protein